MDRRVTYSVPRRSTSPGAAAPVAHAPQAAPSGESCAGATRVSGARPGSHDRVEGCLSAIRGASRADPGIAVPSSRAASARPRPARGCLDREDLRGQLGEDRALVAEPVRSRGPAPSLELQRWVMTATMYGWRWSGHADGQGMVGVGVCAAPSGTNCSRGTRSIAARTGGRRPRPGAGWTMRTRRHQSGCVMPAGHSLFSTTCEGFPRLGAALR